MRRMKGQEGGENYVAGEFHSLYSSPDIHHNHHQWHCSPCKDIGRITVVVS
jgi:hypothetical protein